MRQNIIILLASILTSMSLSASNLRVTNGELQMSEADDGKPLMHYRLTVEWDNAWSNSMNNDAVWLFFKVGSSGNFAHAKVTATGHEQILTGLSEVPAPEFLVPSDQMGVFVYPSTEHRGNISWTIRVSLDPSVLENVRNLHIGRVFGLEMVNVPEGAFWVGDNFVRAPAYGSFYLSDANGEPKGLYSIQSEAMIHVDASDGSLYYKARQPIYQGDQTGPIPTEFPKGFNAFYCMKYELTEGQYVEFLNTLTDYQSQNRANFGGIEYYAKRGSIHIDQGVYACDNYFQPANYISWDDGLAYADWAGLRPMTEFEFTKACRGTELPIERQFPWGTNSKQQVQRYINDEGKLINNNIDENELSNKNKALLGASYYWVMDLAGSLWERVVTIGHEIGRSFKGSHGDGAIGEYGFATNEDWPSGVKDEGGIGFRGGGHYELHKNYSDFNPHSPVAYRPYGAWHGWNRTVAYGQRFVRSN